MPLIRPCLLSLLLGLACAAWAAPAAQAAPAWLTPGNVSEAGENASEPQVAFDAQGEAIAVWHIYDGHNVVVQAALRSAGGSWQTPVGLSEAGEDAYAPHVAFDSQGDAIAVWYREGANTGVQAAFKPAGGSWSSPSTLSQTGQRAIQPDVSFDPQGDALAVWSSYDGSNYIVQSAYRPAGGSWSSPASLSEAGQNSFAPHAAFLGAGEAVAVWGLSSGGHDYPQSATRAAGGSWSSPASLSPCGGPEPPRVAVDEEGEAVAMWSCYNGHHEVAEAAVRPAGGSWQAPASISGEENTGYDSVAVDAQGDAVAAWVRNNGSNTVRAAFKPAGGSWEAPVSLSETAIAAVEAQVSFDAQDDALAVWTKYNGSTFTVQAAMKPAGGSWQAPVDLSNAAQNAFWPHIAFDPEGDALAVWQRSNGTNEIIQAVGYDAAGPLLDELSIPASGFVGVPLSFSASPVDVFSALGETGWSFGDGARAEGASASHSYSTEGEYEVTLASEDALGNATSVSRTVTVTAPPPPPQATPETHEQAPVTREEAPATPVVSTGASLAPAPGNAFQIVSSGADTHGDMLLTLMLPGPGSLSVLGTHSVPGARAGDVGVAPGRLEWGRAQLAVGRSGRATVRVAPGRAGRALLARHRRLGMPLNVTACIDFTPSAGRESTRCMDVRVLSARGVRRARRDLSTQRTARR